MASKQDLLALKMQCYFLARTIYFGNHIGALNHAGETQCGTLEVSMMASMLANYEQANNIDEIICKIRAELETTQSLRQTSK